MTECEKVVLNHRSTSDKTPLVLNEWSGFSRGIEKVSSIKRGVLMEPVHCSVVVICAALCNDLVLRAGVPAKLSREVIRDQLDFLYRIQAKSPGFRRPRRRDVRRSDVVHRDVVSPAALPVRVVAHRSEKRIILCNWHDPSGQRRICQRIAPKIREILYFLCVKRIADLRGANIQLGTGCSFHRDRFRNRTQLQAKVQLSLLTASNIYVCDAGAKSRLFDPNFIYPNFKLQSTKLTTHIPSYLPNRTGP